MNYYSRHRARECTLQVLYCWQLSHNSLMEIETIFLEEYNTIFLEEYNISEVDIDYFKKLNAGIIRNINNLKEIVIPYLSINIDKLGYLEYGILLIALYELMHHIDDIPFKVIINEAIELAKTFCYKNSYKFINGVLHSVITNSPFFYKYKN